MHNDSKTCLDELKWEHAVHAAQIGVEVKDGIVTLAGAASIYYEKWNAERAAQRVYGVRSLAIDMTLKLSQLGMRTDADIAESAKNILDWTNSLIANAVKVLVEDGWLTLSGKVEWQYQRQNAAHCVRYLTAVTGVSNQLVVEPSALAKAVKSDIEAALKRRAIDDAQAISIAVDVKGSDVTLTGTVQNSAERDMAIQAAWREVGVRNVVDKMTLAN